MPNVLSDSWYAIKLNERYWLGHHAVDQCGQAGVLAPSMSGALLVPADSAPVVIKNFRNLAIQHGGQIVKLNLDVETCLDEMLKAKFGSFERVDEESDEENPCG